MEFTVGCLLTEADDMEAYAYAENLRWAWQRWAEYVCEESGGHRWTLYGSAPGPEEPGDVGLVCVVCEADAEYLVGAVGVEAIVGEVDGIRVEYGTHDAEHAFEVPVNVVVAVDQYGPNLDVVEPEYEVWIHVSPAD